MFGKILQPFRQSNHCVGGFLHVHERQVECFVAAGYAVVGCLLSQRRNIFVGAVDGAELLLQATMDAPHVVNDGVHADDGVRCGVLVGFHAVTAFLASMICHSFAWRMSLVHFAHSRMPKTMSR